MIAFTVGERTRLGPPQAGESMFAYLDASARPEVAECRELIEHWLQDYPKENLLRFLGDFRSNDAGQHASAFFELFLFHFFRANGWKILEVEPKIDGVRGNPDFLIESPQGLRVVVEAITPNEKTVEERGKHKLKDDIRNAINAVKIPDYYLMLDAIEAPAQAINKSKLVEALKEWLESGPSDKDIFGYEDKGALVKIRVFRRPGRDVDSPHYRAIGIEMGGVSVSKPGDFVKRALVRKAQKYRELQLPYIIALNGRGFHDTEDDYIAATYGSLAVRYSVGTKGVEGDPEWMRDSDGLFNEGGRARKRHVSGVLFFNGVAPWNWRDRHSCMIHNAFADRPLGVVMFGGDAFLAKEGLLEKVVGGRVGDLFNNEVS